MKHLELFFSTASRKAWIGGFLSALLTPLLTLLTGEDIVSLRTLVVAVLSGILGAAGTYATNNDPVVIDYNDPKLVEDDEIGSHAVDRGLVAPDGPADGDADGPGVATPR
jgi:hypothetical protein